MLRRPSSGTPRDAPSRHSGLEALSALLARTASPATSHPCNERPTQIRPCTGLMAPAQRRAVGMVLGTTHV